MIRFEELTKIKLLKNTKLPKDKWADKKCHFKDIDIEKYNIGILTGKINNIFVVDVDIKDEGIEEFDKYINEYGEPLTVKQKTQSGGYQYFFSYTHTDKNAEYLIEKYLKNRTKFRGKGIDIRNNGGYVVVTPSKIFNREYKFIRNFEEYKVLEIPITLINFLLFQIEINEKLDEEQEQKQQKQKIINISSSKDNLLYDITDEEIKKILSLLSSKYLNNKDDWLKISTALKNLNKYEIWNEWSKQSNHYNLKNNLKMWQGLRATIDINYLINYILNKEQKLNIKPILKYKPIEHLSNTNKREFVI